MLGRITKLKAEIDNVECPPDDSMFNQVTKVLFESWAWLRDEDAIYS